MVISVLLRSKNKLIILRPSSHYFALLKYHLSFDWLSKRKWVFLANIKYFLFIKASSFAIFAYDINIRSNSTASLPNIFYRKTIPSKINLQANPLHFLTWNHRLKNRHHHPHYRLNLSILYRFKQETAFYLDKDRREVYNPNEVAESWISKSS